MYYFDNAATTAIKPKIIAEKMAEALCSGIYGNPSRGAHEFSLNSFKKVYEARSKISEFFGGGGPDRVAFSYNVTTALNLIIKGILDPKDHVIITSTEHNSVLRPLSQMAGWGVDIDMVRTTGDQALIDYDQLEDLIRPNTRMIIANHSSNVTGNLLDIDRIGRLCKDCDILLTVDAAQTAGVIPIDMKKSHIDVLAFTGHKSLFGPQGIGGVIINPSIDIYPIITGGTGIDTFNTHQPESMPTVLESGTINTHSIIGLLAGIEYIEERGIKKLRDYQLELSQRFYDGIKDLEGLRFYGDYTGDRTAIVAFNIGDVTSSDVASILDERYKIAVRGGAHCAPLLHEDLGTVEQGIVRFSFSSMNTKDEINYAIKAITELAKMV